jgi:hypothetical protein
MGNRRKKSFGKSAGVLVALILLIQCSTPLCSGQELSGIPHNLKSPQDLEKWFSSFKPQMQLPDVPQTVEEMLITRAGDCDDFATLASKSLAGLGISSTVLVIKFKGTPIRHAICLWKNESGSYDFFSSQRLVQTEKKSVDSVLKRYYPHAESVSVLDIKERGVF